MRVIAERLILTLFVLLVRRKCPLCGTTFADYPPFVLPYKRFVSAEILERALRYLQNDSWSYEQVTRNLPAEPSNERSPPHNPMTLAYPEPFEECQDPDKETPAPTLSPSTVHRWITSLGALKKTLQAATGLLLDKGADTHRQAVDIAAGKYRSDERKNVLQDAMRLLHAEATYRVLFDRSIFPNLATACGWQ